MQTEMTLTDSARNPEAYRLAPGVPGAESSKPQFGLHRSTTPATLNAPVLLILYLASPASRGGGITWGFEDSAPATRDGLPGRAGTVNLVPIQGHPGTILP